MGTVVSMSEFKGRRSEWPTVAAEIRCRLSGVSGITDAITERALNTARRTWVTMHDINLAAHRASCVAASMIQGNTTC